jgi:hypothetical protein
MSPLLDMLRRFLKTGNSGMHPFHLPCAALVVFIFDESEFSENMKLFTPCVLAIGSPSIQLGFRVWVNDFWGLGMESIGVEMIIKF